MIKEDIFKDIIYWAHRAYQARMVPATSGNISRFEEDIVFMSKSGVCLFDMGYEDISEVNINGDVLNNIKPTSEKLMHLEIYKKRPDIKAILHIHCPYITSFAVCHKKIDEPILPEFICNFGTARAGATIDGVTNTDNKALRGVPSAKYALPSSNELAENVSKFFESGHNAVLMENHGLVAGAKSLKEAFYLCESIQAYTKTYFAAKYLGKIHTLNKDEIKKIQNLKG